MSESNGITVLVTGGSGFIGGWVIIKVLAAGYIVKSTIRSLKKESDARARLVVGGARNLERLTFVEADLTADAGWKEAVEGCAYVLHVASPFPPAAPKHEDELIVPARDGTLRVLRAAKEAGVNRMVVTSSFAAIGYGGEKDYDRVLTEEDWSDSSDPKMTAYTKSKTIAERVAWDFIEKEGGNMELVAINPVAVMGPVLGADYASSLLIVQKLLKGDLPGCPDIWFGVVDVRDVADLELIVMTSPVAKGQRFLAIAGPFVSVSDIARILKEKLPKAETRKVTLRSLPNFLVRVASWFDASVALVVDQLGVVKKASNEKSKTVLGWNPKSNEEAIIATAESLIRLKLV
jgi:nucleoside-diphosphate-sugar epimerase